MTEEIHDLKPGELIFMTDDVKREFIESPDPFTVTFHAHEPKNTVIFEFYKDGKFDVRIDEGISPTLAAMMVTDAMKQYASKSYNDANYNKGWRDARKEKRLDVALISGSVGFFAATFIMMTILRIWGY